jgi:hypothetical protein
MPPKQKTASDILGLPLLLLFCAVAGVFLIRPREEKRIAPKRAARVQLQTALGRLSSMDGGEVTRLRAAADADRQAIAEFETHIPERENVAPFLRTLQSRASALNVLVGDLTPLPASPLAPASVAPYQASSYALNLRGAWEPLVALLADLTTADQLVLPNVEQMKADTAGTTIEARLVVTLVYRGTARPTLPTAPQAGPSAPPVGPPAGPPAAPPTGARP